MTIDIIDSLSADSLRRISAVRTELFTRLSGLPDAVSGKICIYATGSLARLEANPFSDLDAFFYVLGSKAKDLIEPVHSIPTFYNVIKTAETVDFPDFSGGGEYLHFQYLDDVVANIGSREDDYINALTSRMLLILESSYIYNESQFNEARQKVIERYFVDFHDHSSDFRPIFVLNDVLRFWRTLCLNYEHGREWRKDDPHERAKGHLKNLKLRFSRLLICYSFVGALLREGPPLCAEQVLQISARTPIERLNDIRGSKASLEGPVDSALQQYAWFLNAMNAPKDDVLNWIANDANRDEAFGRSKQFIDSMYRIIMGVSGDNGYSRYLVI